MDYQFEKQHQKGKLHAIERIKRLLDENTFFELGQAVSGKKGDWKEINIPYDGVITGVGEINGKRVYIYSQDFTINGGTLGSKHGRKIVNILKRAILDKCPIIGINDSGGARIQEGVNSLKGYGEIFYYQVLASGYIPQISVIAGTCAGGAVYSPALTDFIYVIKDISKMFVTGPQVLKESTGKVISSEELGGVNVHGKECVEIATFNDKVAEIHCFFRFLTARGHYSKVPFYPEYYIKREPVPHHYRSVPQNTVTEILQNLNQLPEDMRLMYLHLWCLGLRINEVCSIKREGYYLKEGVAWLRIYQHKMKMEKVIPIPMILYRSMMVYIERKKIGIDSYVFQNSKGGPFLSTHYWHEMVAWCKKQGIRCGDHVFQTHDYRHSVATALYERGASIQAIREFLGHKHENMTRRYIDCIQKHVDMSSEQYYKEQKSLVSEWRGSDKDGN